MIQAVLLACALGVGFLLANVRSAAISPRAEEVKPAGEAPTTAPSDSVAARNCKHNISLAICPFCDPSLISKLGECAEHGVPEAFCTRCTEALIPAFVAQDDWCAEHALPESQCALCNPEIVKKAATIETPADAGGSSGNAIKVVAAGERRSSQPPSVECRTDRLTVKLADGELEKVVDIDVSEASVQPVSETLRCNAEVAFDSNRFLRLSTRVRGVVREVRKDLGESVAVGETILVIDSAELAAAKATYLQAKALVVLAETSHARTQKLFKSGTSSELEALERETELADKRFALARAEQDLRNLGLSDSELSEIAAGGDTSSLLALKSNIAGEVVERNVTIGEMAEESRTLMAVADTSRSWVMLDVPELDSGKIAIGNSVVLQLEALPGESFGGRISWISPQLDPTTRTIKARAELANDQRRLRANMFGTAQIAIHERENVLLVPKAAVQWEGCCNIVFVRESAAVYRPRKVRLGCSFGDHYEVEEGLLAGEPVVTRGSFLLKTEIMRGNLGAGCCEAGKPRTN